MVHADLGAERVEWHQTPAYVRDLAARKGVPLHVVRYTTRPVMKFQYNETVIVKNGVFQMVRNLALACLLTFLWVIPPTYAQTTPINIVHIALSSDGTQLAIVASRHVFIYDVDDLTTPTHVIETSETSDGTIYDVAFNTTGTRLAYAEDAAGPDTHKTTVLDLENDTARTYPGGKVAAFYGDQLITAYKRDRTNYNLLRLDLETGAAQAVYTVGYTIDDLDVHEASGQLGVVGCVGPYTQSDGGAGDGCLDPTLAIIDLATDTGTALTLLDRFAPPLAWAADGNSLYSVERTVISVDPLRRQWTPIELAANGLQREQIFSYDPIQLDGSASVARDLDVADDGTLLVIYNFELVAFDPTTGEAHALWQTDPDETNRRWQTLTVGKRRVAFAKGEELIVYDLDTETEIGRITAGR